MGNLELEKKKNEIINAAMELLCNITMSMMWQWIATTSSQLEWDLFLKM